MFGSANIINEENIMSMPAGKPYRAIPPSEFLGDYLDELQITQYRLAKEAGIPHATVTRIMKNTSRVTPEIAMRLGLFFGNSVQFWINCQTQYDLFILEKTKGKKIAKSVTPYVALSLSA